MDADTPHPDDIKPYVMIGPSPEYSVTVKKWTFDIAFIVFTIIMGLLLITIALLTVWGAYAVTKPASPPVRRLPQPPDQLKDGSAYTDEQTCLAHDNTTWTDNKCICIPPFFGPSCTQERHDPNYYAMGVIPYNSTPDVNILENNLISNGKSFNENNNTHSCSDLCNKHPQCDAFIYSHPNRCTLLNGSIILPPSETISYHPDIDSTLYMKHPSNLSFSHRIFLSTSGQLPKRYWLQTSTPTFAQVPFNTTIQLNFFPEHIITPQIPKIFTGIFCLHPFSPSDIDLILSQGDTNNRYIHLPHHLLSIPRDWKYKLPMYVLYTNQ